MHSQTNIRLGYMYNKLNKYKCSRNKSRIIRHNILINLKSHCSHHDMSDINCKLNNMQPSTCQQDDYVELTIFQKVYIFFHVSE